MNKVLLISTLLCLTSTVSFAEPAQDMVTVEIFVDSDPGFGNGNIFSGKEGDNSYTLPTKELTPGAHLISVRAKDSNGLWSATVTNPLYVVEEVIMADAEYFIDADPGIGNGTQVEATEEETVISIPTRSLSTGAHLISVRARDSKGQGSATVVNPLYVVEPMRLIRAEYYVDDDPGQGNGTTVAVQTDGNASFVVPTQGLSTGMHRLVFRGQLVNSQYVSLFEAPFRVTEVNGVTDIEWAMDVNIACTDGVISVSGESLADGCTVEVFDLNGIKLISDTSGIGRTELTFDTDRKHGPFIVTVTSEDGMRYVKLVK